MAVFNYSENITGIFEFIQVTNIFVGGMLGMGMLIVIFMVSFLSTKNFSYDKAFGFSAFLTLISAIFLRYMDLISDAILTICIIATIGAGLLLMKERSVEGV
jgi:hypothetical protein